MNMYCIRPSDHQVFVPLCKCEVAENLSFSTNGIYDEIISPNVARVQKNWKINLPLSEQ